MKSAVTGGCGFIGQAIVRALQARGDDVRVLDIAEDCPVEGVDYRRTDITDRDAVDAALEDVELVVHNAAVVHTRQTDEAVCWKVNLGGTQNVLEAARARKVPRFVQISSGSVVYEGRDIENGDESLPYASVSQAPYADSKIAAERWALQQHGEGIATCALRPHVVFGPGDNRFMPALLAKGPKGKLRVQVGMRDWLSDYTYVTNLADSVVLADVALREGRSGGEPYFITNGEPIPFWDFVRKVAARLGWPPIRYRVPRAIPYGIAAAKETFDAMRGVRGAPEDGMSRFAIRYLCTHHYFSIEKARRELGYEPAVSIDEGIEITCADLEARGVV